MSLSAKLRALAELFGEDDAVKPPEAAPGGPVDPFSDEDPFADPEVPDGPPGGDPGADDAVPPPPDAPPAAQEPVSDKEVFCCPFDGSGNIIGQADNSIKCEHCGTVFAVEVRPAISGAPRFDESGNPVVIDEFEGKPYPTPGQAQADGGDPLDPEADPMDPGAEDPFGGDPMAEDDGEEDDGDDEDLPPFMKGSKLYVGPNGQLLNEKAFVAYLASTVD